ncbi:hypothetical protein ACERII_04445 [Evansella sp. AB-rgal1]|uniref:hypothetical protein n=1 Tax=Evansella sp. AB-rgal1 TaxID=3242696 RepID=UPI00359D8C2D
MKPHFWVLSAILNFVLGIAFHYFHISLYLYLSVAYVSEAVFGIIIDSMLEPDFFIMAFLIAFLLCLFYIPISILLNVFVYKKLLSKKYLYVLFALFFWCLGFVYYVYDKL